MALAGLPEDVRHARAQAALGLYGKAEGYFEDALTRVESHLRGMTAVKETPVRPKMQNRR